MCCTVSYVSHGSIGHSTGTEKTELSKLDMIADQSIKAKHRLTTVPQSNTLNSVLRTIFHNKP
jgi:hypothetical protein